MTVTLTQWWGDPPTVKTHYFYNDPLKTAMVTDIVKIPMFVLRATKGLFSFMFMHFYLIENRKHLSNFLYIYTYTHSYTRIETERLKLVYGHSHI